MHCPSCGTLNPEGSNFCAQCGRSLKLTDRPRSFVEWLQRGAHKEGERRQVTILACDTVGSSLLAEHMDPEEFLDLMNRAFEAIIAPVFDRGGYLARLEGDGFKAFFGAPEAHDDDPLRAVRAGLEIQTAARRVAKELELEGMPSDFTVRVGIHTDHVVVGPVGTADAVEYTAMGIGIVVAARLEMIAQPGTVLISEATHRLIEPYVQVAPLGPTAVKGRSQPVHIFEVIGLRRPAELGEALGVRSPLVGRVVERSMLTEAVAKLCDQWEQTLSPAETSTPSLAGFLEVGDTSPVGSLSSIENAAAATVLRGGIVHIVGETGVGKSRLLSHARNQMTADRPELIWLDGRALRQGQGAYGVLADLVRGYLGIGVDDSVHEMWAKLRNRMDYLFPPSPAGRGRLSADASSGESAELALHLANLLSLHLEANQAQRMSDLDPEAQERQIFRALRRLCERLTEDSPLVLALDDLQASDEGAIRLLKDLLHLVDERPVLFIFSFRPELEADCWQLRDLARRAHRKNNIEIVLHSLSAEAIDELIDNLLESPNDEGISESVRALIRHRSGGNPLFIEEVVRSLVDRGVLERSGERWQVVGEVPANYIPETLHGVISARLDRLDPETRHTLQIAAVIGHTFSYRVLHAVTGNGNDLERHLAHLQRAELVRELRRGTEQEYSFTHTLTQQVAYETLLRRQRRDHHRRVAQCIEESYADRLEEHYERLAYHYANARDWPRALDYHIRFATQAQLRYANSKASEHYQSAWEIVRSGRAGDEATQFSLHEAQGNLDLLAGEYQRASLHYEAALALTHDLPQQARLLRKLGNVSQAAGNYEAGIQFLQRGLKMADAIGEGPELASLYVGLGQIYHRQDNYEGAVDLGLRALQIFERVENRPGTALAGNLLGIAYWAMGDLNTAHAYLEKSLLIHASLGDVRGLAASYNNLGRVLADQGQLDRAMSYFRQSQQLCLEIGYQHGLATALSHLSELYQHIGQTEEAWTCQEEAFEIYNRIGFDGLAVQPEVLKMQVW
jgi:class 3 adenylate cyclase/tetratricopeptide (TPR) repeat protein